MPDFGSGYIFELRNDTKGNHYVQVLLKNSKPNDTISITPVQIEGCETICPLDKFVSLLQGALVTDYNAACREQQPAKLADKITNYFHLIMSWFSTIF